MKQKVTHPWSEARIEIQGRQVRLLFPNRPAVRFSLDIPDLRCAGYSPTYTYKAWMWCAYINALHAAKIELGNELSQELFQKVWRGVQKKNAKRFVRGVNGNT